MQIIQMADLHITKNDNIDSLKPRISKLYEALLRDNLRKDDSTVFCLLGDIVDKGDHTSYKTAIELINYTKQTFSDYNPKFHFTPGNHDLCNCPVAPPTSLFCPEGKCIQACSQECTIEHFNNFVKNFNNNDNNPSDDLLYEKYDDIDILLVSSISHKNCKYGQINFDALEHVSLDKPSLLVTHHAFFSANNEDNAAIRNAYKILDVIEKKNIIGVLHGHTHGYKNITIGEKCQVVGVGPFLKRISNIQNQANLVVANSSGIHKVINYIYMGEDHNRYDSKIVFSKKEFIYRGSNIGEVYENIKLDVQKYGVISNMHINLSMSFESFSDQINQLFCEQIPIAKLWQETEFVDKSLYYNHGLYMKDKNNKKALDFLVEELNSKATSSRAIVPLINFNNIVESGDRFLPSFVLVQFGFNDDNKKDELLVTFYLRALEVNHFLKINFCEIYLMCKRIQEDIRSVKRVNVTIIAFRVQYKEKFGCFRRAEIDKATEAQITRALENNPKSITEWLEEKKNFNETVVKKEGIKSLCNALEAINEDNTIKKIFFEVSHSILEKMKELEKEQKKTSNYSATKKNHEELDMLFCKLIDLLQQGEIYESRTNNKN